MDNAIVKPLRRPCNHFFNHGSLDAANGFPAALKKRSRRSAQTVEEPRFETTQNGVLCIFYEIKPVQQILYKQRRIFDKLKRLRCPQALAYNN